MLVSSLHPSTAGQRQIKEWRFLESSASTSEVCRTQDISIHHHPPRPLPVRLRSLVVLHASQSMGPNVATPELFAEALFTDTSSWTGNASSIFPCVGPFPLAARSSYVMRSERPPFIVSSGVPRAGANSGPGRSTVYPHLALDPSALLLPPSFRRWVPVIDRGPFEALLPITVSPARLLELMGVPSKGGTGGGRVGGCNNPFYAGAVFFPGF